MNIKHFKAIKLTNKENGINVTMIIEAKNFDNTMKAASQTTLQAEEVEVTEELLKDAQIYTPICINRKY